MAWYVFALVDAVPESRPGKGIGGALSMLPVGDAFVVAERRADVPPVEFGSLATHHDVVTRMAACVPAILPVRFGTLLERAALDEALEDREEVIAGAFALASGGAAALSLGARPRPTLVVENGLFAPVVLALNGGARQRLAPGDSLRLPLARGEQATARWQLVVPDGDDGEPVGEALGSSFVLNNPSGEMRHRLDPASIGRNYLIPTITNSTADTLRAEMTDSAGARLACDCTVPPGAGRHVLGWVRRDQLSTILVRNASSRAIIYESLIARADNATGVLDLSLRAADFVPPTTLAVRATDSSQPTVIRAPPPEIRREVPLPAIADSVDTTTAAPATEKPKDRNVLAPIFRNR